MRPLMTAMLLIAGSSAFAQQRNLNPIGNNGNVLRPGIPQSGTPARGGGFRRGGGFNRGATLVVPYPAYGYGFDGFYAGYPGYATSGFYSPAPGAYDPIFGVYNPGVYGTAGAYPAAANYATGQQSPTVVINQNFAPDGVNPRMVDFSNAPSDATFKKYSATDPNAPAPADATTAPVPAAGDQPPLYLIAMKDHTIYPAIAYWVMGDTLNYVTLQGALNHTSLGLVDRDLSKRLNQERNLDLRLPPQ